VPREAEPDSCANARASGIVTAYTTKPHRAFELKLVCFATGRRCPMQSRHHAGLPAIDFTTELPRDCLYSPSHAWLARRPGERWRVGLTKFATRMLGEMVDHGFQVAPGAAIEVGEVIGWIEASRRCRISTAWCAVSFRAAIRRSRNNRARQPGSSRGGLALRGDGPTGSPMPGRAGLP